MITSGNIEVSHAKAATDGKVEFQVIARFKDAITPRMMDQLRKLLCRLVKPLTPYYERVSDATSPAIAQLRARYQKLESRERTLVKIAGIVVGLFFVYNFIYMPIDDLARLHRYHPRYSPPSNRRSAASG